MGTISPQGYPQRNAQAAHISTLFYLCKRLLTDYKEGMRIKKLKPKVKREKLTQFNAWLRAQGLTRDSAAAMFGVSRSTVNNWCRAGSGPTRRRAVLIEQVSKGAVRVEGWE